MNKGWEIKKLSEVCAKITDGTHQTPKYFNEGVIFLSSKNVTSGFIDWHNIKYIDEKQHLEMHKRVAPKVNDILLAKNGTTGVAAIVDRDLVFDIYVSLALLRPLDGLLPVYLLHFINSPLAKNQFNKRLKGIGVPNLHLEEIREVEIPLPPLPEQQRIVSILDEAFAAIAKAKANTEQNLRNAKELFNCYLLNVLSDKKWETKTIGDVCRKVEYGSATKSKNIGKIAVLRMGNIQNGRFNWEKLVYSDDEKENKQYLLEYNDVLFNRTNSPELVGKTAIYKGEMPAIFAGYLIRIHRKEDLIDADFLNYYLNSEIALEYGKTVVISSVNQANINGTKLKGYPIPCPPLKEQQAIVQKLHSLSVETKKLEAIYQQKINDLEELKKSILQKAFSGELTAIKTHDYA